MYAQHTDIVNLAAERRTFKQIMTAIIRNNISIEHQYTRQPTLKQTLGFLLNFKIQPLKKTVLKIYLSNCAKRLMFMELI